ncbi:MAG: hypothetical protein M3332_10415 [Actinomycetota bacterium]|nr:hypothetical protein [Actinomycetota bacterium]
MTSVDDLTQGLDQLRDSIAQTARAAPQVARQEIQREGRAYFRGAVVASVITSLLIGVPLLMLNRRIAENTAEDQVRAAQFRAASQDIQRLAQGAYDLGVVANAELARRGLATVSIPAPGTASDSAVLSAASTAQVAVQIARESIAVPTPAEIQAEVAAQLAKLPPPPIGPTPQQLDEAVQAYLTANAAAFRGPQGDQGEPGESPPCLAAPTQCQGVQGEQGLRGEPPVGWTVAEADGSITACERVEGFDPRAPRYQCSHGPPPSPATATTTTPPPPSDEGLLPVVPVR